MRTVEGRRESERSWCTWLPAVLVPLVDGCVRHASQQAAPSAGASVAGTVASRGAPARPPGATLAVARPLFAGDSDEIGAYLRLVKEINPAKFDAQRSSDTGTASKERAMRSLPPISRDGSTCHFDSREPVARWLKVGSIRWADDLAVRRADRIDGAGDISTVHAPRGSLTEGCTRGDVAFDATPSLPDYCTKLMLLPISFVGDVVDTINKEGTTHTEVFRRGDEALDSSVKVCEVAG